MEKPDQTLELLFNRTRQLKKLVDEIIYNQHTAMPALYRPKIEKLKQSLLRHRLILTGLISRFEDTRLHDPVVLVLTALDTFLEKSDYKVGGTLFDAYEKALVVARKAAIRHMNDLYRPHLPVTAPVAPAPAGSLSPPILNNTQLKVLWKKLYDLDKTIPWHKEADEMRAVVQQWQRFVDTELVPLKDFFVPEYLRVVKEATRLMGKFHQTYIFYTKDDSDFFKNHWSRRGQGDGYYAKLLLDPILSTGVVLRDLRKNLSKLALKRQKVR